MKLLDDEDGLAPEASSSATDPYLLTILAELQKSAQLGISNQQAIVANQAASVAGQAALATALNKVGDSASVLKPSQPHFNPQGNLEDYLRYKNWRR